MSLKARLEYAALLRQKIVESVNNGISESKLEELTGVPRTNINRIKNGKNKSGCIVDTTAFALGCYFFDSEEKAALAMKEGYPSWYATFSERHFSKGVKRASKLNNLTQMQYDVFLMSHFDCGVTIESISKRFGDAGKEALLVLENRGILENKDGVYYGGMIHMSEESDFLAIAKNHFASYHPEDTSNRQGLATVYQSVCENKRQKLQKEIVNCLKNINAILLDKSLDTGKDNEMFRMSLMYDWMLENKND